MTVNELKAKLDQFDGEASILISAEAGQVWQAEPGIHEWTGKLDRETPERTYVVLSAD
jgi:hypothetical protein